jgi:serine/threonine protein phosphatase PrpC
MGETMTACPTCHAAVGDSELFCEACGAALTPTVVAAEAQPIKEATREPAQPDDLTGTASTCQSCGGKVSSDGYCDTCGARAPTRRDHFSESPAPWVAAVSDRGIRHTRNEDAVALAADAEPGSRAVLVVCDGVSNSLDSDVASLAAARAARAVLGSSRSRGMGTETSQVAAVIARIEAATNAASDAVLEVSRRAKSIAAVGSSMVGSAAASKPTAVSKPTAGTTPTTGGGPPVGASPATGSPTVTNPASCTFVAAVLEQNLVVVGSVGDSRAYWLPDSGSARALTVDDSFAQEQIAAGVARLEAETGPQSHAITRWLGVDAPDHTPTTASMTVTEPGWLLVCSDGLWNYCSPAPDLAALVERTASGSPSAAEPLALAGALVDWANAQGGQDNITVALARMHPS